MTVRPRRWRTERRQTGERISSQAMVEFALISVAFFLIVFGTVDLDRLISLVSQLHK